MIATSTPVHLDRQQALDEFQRQVEALKATGQDGIAAIETMYQKNPNLSAQCGLVRRPLGLRGPNREMPRQLDS